MDDPIGIVAMAIKAKVPDGYGMTDTEAAEYARAALLALREPTEGMVEAMQVEVNLLDNPDPPNAFQFLSHDEVNSIWQAAIDHALQTQGKGNE